MTADKNNITLRSDKSSPLTQTEVDTNFQESKNSIDELGRRVVIRENRGDLKARDNNIGWYVQLSGLTANDDGRGGLYEIKGANTGTPDDETIIALDNGNQAHLVGFIQTSTGTQTFAEALEDRGAVFDSVDDLKNAANVKVGQKVRTLGYYSPGDGGGNDYEIVAAATGTADGGSFIDLSGSGFQAKILASNYVSVVSFGAKGDGTTDDTTAFQNALDAMAGEGGIVYMPIRPKGYPITTIRVPIGVGIDGVNAGYPLHTLYDWDKTEETCKTVWIKAIGSVNTPVIEMEYNTSVSNFRMIDLRQKFSVATSDESFNDTQIAIQLGYSGNFRNHNQSIKSVCFFGFKRFIEQWVSGSDFQVVARLKVDNCHGMPFESFLKIAWAADTIWITECHANYTSLRGIRDESQLQPTQHNLSKKVKMFLVGKADDIRFTNCFGMFLRAFISFYRDAYVGDPNNGGGFSVINGGVDVCHRAIEFFRDGANPIGGIWVGGQIIPTVYIENSLNCAFFVDNSPSPASKLQMDVVGVSIHRGGINPAILDLQDSSLSGPGTRKMPRWVAEMGGAVDTIFNFFGGRAESFYPSVVNTGVAYSNGCFVNLNNVKTRLGTNFANTTRMGGGVTAEDGAIKYIIPSSGGSATNYISIEQDDGTGLAKWATGGGTLSINSQNRIDIRPGYNASKGVSFDEFINAMYPSTDNTLSLGRIDFRWKDIFSIDGTIKTSDEREKQDVRKISETEREIAVKLKGMIRAFKWESAVEEKGKDKARIHFGVMAQQVCEVFAEYGLDAGEYGIFCYDEWQEKDAVIHEWDAEHDTEGNVIREAGSEVIEAYQPAGDRFGIRYEELLAFIISAL